MDLGTDKNGRKFITIIYYVLICLSCIFPACIKGNESKELFVDRYGHGLAEQLLDDDYITSKVNHSLDAQDKKEIFEYIEDHYSEELIEFYSKKCINRIDWLECPSLRKLASEIVLGIFDIFNRKSRQCLFFEFYRALSFYTEIPSFHRKKWIEEQLHLLQLMQKVALQSDDRTMTDFPSFPNKPNSRFVFEGVEEKWFDQRPTWHQEQSTPYPYAVFKSNGEWDREQIAWTIASLFEIEDSFTPTGVIEICGTKCSIQPYWNYRQLDWPENRETSFQPPELNSSVVLNFSFEHYIDIVLGTLILSLYDQSSLNCRYRQLANGKYALVNFDNGACLPSRNGIFGEYNQGKLNILARTCWAWYFDFPQFDWMVYGYSLDHLYNRVLHWEEKLHDLKRVLSHPLNNFLQSAEVLVIKALENRLKLLKKFILTHDIFTLRDLLYTIIPEYELLITSLEILVPTSHGTTMSSLGCVFFTMPMLRYWMINRSCHPEENVDLFIEWLQHTFAREM